MYQKDLHRSKKYNFQGLKKYRKTLGNEKIMESDLSEKNRLKLPPPGSNIDNLL